MLLHNNEKIFLCSEHAVFHEEMRSDLFSLQNVEVDSTEAGLWSFPDHLSLPAPPSATCHLRPGPQGLSPVCSPP